MAVQITILRVVEELKNLIKRKEIRNPELVDRLNCSIKNLEVLHLALLEESSYVASRELLTAVYLAEDTIDNFFATKDAVQKQNLFVNCMNLKSLCSEKLFVSEMEKVVRDIRKKSTVSEQDQSPVKRFSLGEEDDLIPRKKANIFDLEDRIEELAELILYGDPSLFHISVVDDQCGCRATTLMKIYHNIDIKKHFDCRAWVRVSQGFEKRRLVIDICTQVGLIKMSEVDKTMSLVSLEQDLSKFLLHKKYLVILIDVRTPEIWEILKFCLPNLSNGSRVIFGFREADAARNPNMTSFGRDYALYLENVMEEASTIRDDTGPTEEEQVPNEVGWHLEGAFDYLDETDIVGLKNKILELFKLTLTSGKYLLISVVGVAGSGKTTVVKTVFNNPKIKSTFAYRAWINVYVSHNYEYDMRSILIDILKQFKDMVKYEEKWPLEKLERTLRETLSQKRFLIVLDEVHLPGAWYDLQRILSPTLSIGSKVILITHDIVVARSFSPSIVLLKLDTLEEPEGWRLFLKKVHVNEANQDLKNLRETVWRKCRGLPHAISVLGEILSKKKYLDYSEWAGLIEHIMPGEKKEDIVTNENAASDEDLSTSCDILASLDKQYIWTLGYKVLSPHLKACLEYLCLFPRSHEIPVRRMFHLWLAERLGTPREQEENDKEMAPEDLVKKDFKELEEGNMIEVVKQRPDGTTKTFRLQRTLYDSLLSKAEKRGFFHVHRKLDPAFGTQQSCIRRLVEHLYINNTPLSGKSIENLHSYISFNTRKRDKPAEEIGNFLYRSLIESGLRLLRVLDLENVYKPVLTETLGKLKLLRYLGLRWTFIDSIPMSVGYLPSLECLDVKHTHITTLPKSIWMAGKLRHLYLNEIEFPMLVQNPSASVCLPNLQTLSGLFIGKGCPQDIESIRLKRLRKLGLTFINKAEKNVTSWISSLTSLESLRLRSINNSTEPSEINLESINALKKLTKLYLLGKLPGGANLREYLPQNLRLLTLSVSELVEDPMPKLGHLKQLNLLNLFADSYLGEEMTCHSGAFPKLKVLRLWMLKDLQKWTIEKGAMPLLSELEIRNCFELRYIDGLHNLTTLKELILTDTPLDLETLKLHKPSNRDWNFVIKDSRSEEAKKDENLIPQVRGPVLVPLDRKSQEMK